MNEEYHKRGVDSVRKSYELLQSPEWKLEKTTKTGDIIRTLRKEKLGKVFRLTGKIDYPAKELLEELYYNHHANPKWNPNMLESKVLYKVNSYTDIAYQAAAGAGGGFIKNRDFVCLRCWRLCSNGEILTDESEKPIKIESNVSIISSNVSAPVDYNSSKDNIEPSLLNDAFGDIENEIPCEGVEKKQLSAVSSDRIYIIASVSIDYALAPPISRFVRGENYVSCWAMREIENETDACIFEWMSCADLKGYLPRYIIDAVFTTFMADFLVQLRKYVKELRAKKIKALKKIKSRKKLWERVNYRDCN